MYVVYNQEPTETNGILGSVMEIYFKGLNILFKKYTINPISTYIRMHAVHQVTQFQKCYIYMFLPTEGICKNGDKKC